jgi:hypothetical protein
VISSKPFEAAFSIDFQLVCKTLSEMKAFFISVASRAGRDYVWAKL